MNPQCLEAVKAHHSANMARFELTQSELKIINDSASASPASSAIEPAQHNGGTSDDDFGRVDAKESAKTASANDANDEGCGTLVLKCGLRIGPRGSLEAVTNLLRRKYKKELVIRDRKSRPKYEKKYVSSSVSASSPHT